MKEKNYFHKQKIGFYKLGFETHEYDANNVFNANDKNGMLTEVNLVMKAFQLHGYEVEYVNTNDRQFYDRIFVFNGYPKFTSIANLWVLCKELNYILTDTRFINVTRNDRHSHYIDNFFVQSDEMQLLYKPTFNSKLHMLPIFEHNFYNVDDGKSSLVANKKSRIIFGGSERERRDKFIEYIYKPIVDAFVNYKDGSADNRLPILDYKKRLSEYKYGIVIINPYDVEVGNITWRYYEYIVNNVITFVDRDSDPRNKLLLTPRSFLYVSSYDEMYYKMEMIENDPLLYNSLLIDQQCVINNEQRSGYEFVKSLLEGRNENAGR